MDKHVYDRLWNDVFLSAIGQRHRGAKCALLMDNSSTHDVALSSEVVEIFFLPDNTTAVYRSKDAGVIVSLKRRYKRRLLVILVRSLPVRLTSPSPTPQVPPPPPPLPPPLPPAPPLPPPPTPPVAMSFLPSPPPSRSLRGFCSENERLWRAPSVDVLRVHGAPRSAALEAPDDAADAAVQQGVLRSLLPLPSQTPRPVRDCGLAGRGSAHLLDAATLIVEEWETVTSTSTLHCWVKSTILLAAVSAFFAASHGVYRNGFANVEHDVDEVLALMRGTSLGQDMIGVTSEGDAREAERS